MKRIHNSFDCSLFVSFDFLASKVALLCALPTPASDAWYAVNGVGEMTRRIFRISSPGTSQLDLELRRELFSSYLT